MKTIRHVVVVFLVGGLLGVPPLFAQASGQWVGVWQLSIQNSEDGPVYWVISEDQGKLSARQYSGAWRSSPVTLTQVDGSNLALTFQSGGFKISVTAAREGDRLTGTWKLMHPQYSAEKPVTGLRVIKANHWDPLEGIRKIQDAAGLADVSSVLRKAAAGKDFQKFAAAWDSDIGAPYYVFVQTFWDQDPARKSEKLRSLYRVLRSKSFEANVKATVAMRKEVIELIKAKQPALYLANPTVIVPSLSSGDASVVDAVDGKVYVKAEVPEKSPSRSNTRLKWLLARGHLEMAFMARFPVKIRALRIELIRQGVAGYLSADLLGVSLADVLGTTPEKAKESLARLDSYRKGLAKVANAEPEEVSRIFPRDPLGARQIVDMVGYKFGEQVVQRFNPDELSKLDRARLLELADDYLQSGG